MENENYNLNKIKDFVRENNIGEMFWKSIFNNPNLTNIIYWCLDKSNEYFNIAKLKNLYKEYAKNKNSIEYFLDKKIINNMNE